ncbi:MAG: fluoride efflux transporter CrcB [Candidatus Heimdallarchaeota archaeon]|nr:fluoride efflux transporter CrcB [Candidatus Heimdallarchaeota archaeon]
MLERISPIILIALGGSMGAITRYIVSAQLLENKEFPWGTLTVNILGSLLLGILITFYERSYINQGLFLLGGVGFLGSFTTMSSFAVETMQLIEKNINLALRNIGLMMVLVFAGVFIGRYLALFSMELIGCTGSNICN